MCPEQAAAAARLKAEAEEQERWKKEQEPVFVVMNFGRSGKAEAWPTGKGEAGGALSFGVVCSDLCVFVCH